MSVPDDVPANVPAAAAPAERRRARSSRKKNDGKFTHLTRNAEGWRFQMRVPSALAQDFRLAGLAPSIRATVGPRGRGEARRLARQLATICDTVFALAAAQKDVNAMNTMSPQEENLAKQVIAACQTAIGSALKQPKQAIGLARGLGTALTTLQLVQSEVAKRTGGASAVVDNADALTRHALADVLKLSAQPNAALAALAAVPTVAPSAPPASAPPSPPHAHGARPLPTFSEVSHAYIAMRIENGADKSEIQRHRIATHTFLPIAGDLPIDEYYGSQLQNYVSRMAFWPANASKRGELAGVSVLGILEANKDLILKPLARKTLKDGYVASIRTQARSLMADLRYRDPFSGVRLRWPNTASPPRPREGIGTDVLDRVFCRGAASGLLDEAMLPLYLAATGRRLALGVYLRGEDIRQKYGVWIAQTSGIVQGADGRWTRIPVKTDESMTFYVLHDFLSEIGFVDWARAQHGWVFASLHEHPEPAKYTSKLMNRILRRCGAAGGNAEVFHSLRGDAIDAMRDAKIEPRARRLQAGHELNDVHERYGFRALTAEQCRELARLPLPKEINWSVFKGLDFDKLAAARRSAGRRARKGG
jgi:hypothetical protein